MLYSKLLSKLLMKLSLYFVLSSSISAQDKQNSIINIKNNYFPSINLNNNQASIVFSNLINLKNLSTNINISNYYNHLPINLNINYNISNNINISLSRRIDDRLTSFIANYKILANKISLQIGVIFNGGIYLGIINDLKDENVNNLTTRLVRCSINNECNCECIINKILNCLNCSDLIPKRSATVYSDIEVEEEESYNQEENKEEYEIRQYYHPVVINSLYNHVERMYTNSKNIQLQDNEIINGFDNNIFIRNEVFQGALITQVVIGKPVYIKDVLQQTNNISVDEKIEYFINTLIKDINEEYSKLCDFLENSIEDNICEYIKVNNNIINELTTLLPYLREIIPLRAYRNLFEKRYITLIPEMVNTSIISFYNKGDIFVNNIPKNDVTKEYIDCINDLDIIFNRKAEELFCIPKMEISSFVDLLLKVFEPKLGINSEESKRRRYDILFKDIILLYTGECDLQGTELLSRRFKNPEQKKYIEKIKLCVEKYETIIELIALKSFFKANINADIKVKISSFENKINRDDIKNLEEVSIIFNDIGKKDTLGGDVTNFSRYICGFKLIQLEGLLQILNKTTEIIKKDNFKTIINSDTLTKIIKLVERIAKEKYTININTINLDDKKTISNIKKIIFSIEKSEYENLNKLYKFTYYISLESKLRYIKFLTFQYCVAVEKLNIANNEKIKELVKLNESIEEINSFKLAFSKILGRDQIEKMIRHYLLDI